MSHARTGHEKPIGADTRGAHGARLIRQGKLASMQVGRGYRILGRDIAQLFAQPAGVAAESLETLQASTGEGA
jgi:hypothetical protein